MENHFEHSVDHFKMVPGEQDFYVLKFPSKLWRIISECRSGAIRWGPFGKTILINYDLFQAEFLECPVPKFKTRNMASFVRQLNMYGFKKMQPAQKKLLRFYHVHEFFHENFRYGRPDLLCLVKRRAIPLKFPKLYHHYDKKYSRLDICRNTFEDSLLQSNEFTHFWKLNPQLCSTIGEGARVLKPVYRIRIIPAQDIELNDETQELTAVVLRDYEKVLHREIGASIDEPPESDIENNEDDEFDPLMFDADFAHTTAEELLILNNGMKGIPVRVKNGFDGSHYIIDIVESTLQGAPDSSPDRDVSKESDPLEIHPSIPTPVQTKEPILVSEEESAPTIHVPEDDFFSCLTSAISGVDIQ